MSARVFDAREAAVVEGAGCTWCGVEVGEPCRHRKWGVWLPVRTHAQRWRDYWNATHGPGEQTDVFSNPRTRMADTLADPDHPDFQEQWR